MNQVEQYVYDLLSICCERKATDLHFIPSLNSVRVQSRILQEFMDEEPILPDFYERICMYIKYLAHLDVTDTRVPQGGRFSKTLSLIEISVRVSILPTIYGESMVLRLLYNDHIVPLKYLSLFPNQSKLLIDIASKQKGLFVFSGATGSGKTTTMYSILQSLQAQRKLHIITLEDPVEIKCDHMTQVQINENVGLSYDAGLKAILRHDPDVILVGEIRDRETAELAHRAALTGHLVFTTIHAKDTVGALLRFVDFGIPIIELEQSIQCIVSQELVQIGNQNMIRERPVNEKFTRTCLFEILTRGELSRVFKGLKKGEELFKVKNTLQKIRDKGVAYGFLSENETIQ